MIYDEEETNFDCSDSFVDGIATETYKWYLSYIHSTANNSQIQQKSRNMIYVNMYIYEIVPVNPAVCFELPVTTSEFPASPSPPHSETHSSF